MHPRDAVHAEMSDKHVGVPILCLSWAYLWVWVQHFEHTVVLGMGNHTTYLVVLEEASSLAGLPTRLAGLPWSPRKQTHRACNTSLTQRPTVFLLGEVVEPSLVLVLVLVLVLMRGEVVEP